MLRLDAFLDHIGKSGLVDAAELERVVGEISSEPQADAALRLARALIQRGILTHYQARKLLGGATRGFFLGDYRLLRPLGEGGMGKVYLASHARSGERVAIKVLPPRRARESSDAVNRFRREMDLSRRVVHRNVARTLDVGEEGDIAFMVLEYIPGESLYQAVKGPRGGPLRVNDAARLFLEVLDGLDAAHAVDIIHRDMKPSNIMITPDGQAKLLDLGLARALGEEQPITRPNIIVGTLDYASPEQIVDAASADRRSDLYSLGCTLYFAIAGRPPFEGGDMVNKIVKQRMVDPEPLERVARGVPPEFAAIVRKLMAKAPEDRYQDCQEVKRDLARWTDPERIRRIVGGEADGRPSLRYPLPELDEQDLRLIPDDAVSAPALALRQLGDAAPAPAPRSRPTGATPSRAIVRPPTPQGPDDSRWLVQVIAVAVIVGLLAILGIALFV